MTLGSNRGVAIKLSSKIKTQSACIASDAKSKGVPYDVYTTTNPNSAMKNSYKEVQSICKSFSSILNRDANLLVRIADKFEKLDKDMSKSLGK